MTVRAKFYVSKLDPYSPPSTGGEVVLFPVYSEDPNHENKKFWDATPSGTIQMIINNPAAFERFTMDKQFYVDFTPAPKG